jgi:hypothetical protein
MRNRNWLVAIVLGSLFASPVFAHAIIDPPAGGFQNSLVGDLGAGAVLWLQLMLSTVL